MLLLHLWHVNVGARQPDRQLRAEAKGRVVPAVELDRRDRKVGPTRELRREQASDEGRRDVRSVHVWVSVWIRRRRLDRLSRRRDVLVVAEEVGRVVALLDSGEPVPCVARIGGAYPLLALVGEEVE